MTQAEIISSINQTFTDRLNSLEAENRKLMAQAEIISSINQTFTDRLNSLEAENARLRTEVADKRANQTARLAVLEEKQAKFDGDRTAIADMEGTGAPGAAGALSAIDTLISLSCELLGLPPLGYDCPTKIHRGSMVITDNDGLRQLKFTKEIGGLLRISGGRGAI